jgi:hypothetical protein
MILAFSSEFFEAMLLGEYQETQTSVVDLQDTNDPRNIFPEIMKILYSGRIEITYAKVVPLLAMSDVLLIKSIHEKCVDFISTQLNKNTALPFLLDAIELHQARLIQQCINVLASSFLHICDDTSFSKLDLDHFTRLICHPRLAVKDEYKLCRVILQYLQGDSHTPTTLSIIPSSGDLTPDTIASPSETLPKTVDPTPMPAAVDPATVKVLFQNVKFYYFTFEQLLEVSRHPLVPKELLVEPLLARLQAQEAPKVALPRHMMYKPRLSAGIRFEVNDSEKPLGIIHWLGTNEGTSAWSNPATSGVVSVHASSVERGTPNNLVDTEPQELWTHDVPASWLSINLIHHCVLPSAYTLRHGGNYRADSLRNWDFQGSVDGKTWVVLKRHSNDPTLSAPFAVKTFPLEKAALVPYQWFRIIQTGHNSTNHNFLVLSGFEVYGELWDREAWALAQSTLSPDLPPSISSATST